MKKLSSFVPYIFCFAYLSIYFLVSTIANQDNSEGRFLLSMDELISYDQTLRIIQPQSARDFLYQTLDGDEHRYGRPMYWMLSLFSAIPYQFFGESGLILSNRILLSIFTIASIVLVALLMRHIVKRNYTLYFLCPLILVPTLPYASSIPKPEPFLLFVLLLFILQFYLHRFRYGVYFLLLGVAFSIKISSLPFLLIALVYPSVVYFYKFRSIPFKELWKGVGWTFTGFLACTPYLGMLLFGEWSYFVKYLNWTFLNTGHGIDDLTVSFNDWILLVDRSWSGYFKGSFFLFPLSAIGIYFSKFKYKRLQSNRNDQLLFLLLVSSLSFIFPILLFVKRIWLHYLHIGLFLLFTFSLIVLLDFFRKSLEKNKLSSIFILFILFFPLVSVPRIREEYEILATRTQTEWHKTQVRKYNEILKFFETRKRPATRVFYDPLLFSIDGKFPNIITEGFWGPFLQWEKRYEYVVIGDENTYLPNFHPNPTRVDFNDIQRAQKLYMEHVLKKDKFPHYLRAFKSEDGLLILENSQIEQ